MNKVRALSMIFRRVSSACEARSGELYAREDLTAMLLHLSLTIFIRVSLELI